MAKVVAKFEKVSYEQFKKDWGDTFNASDEEIIRKIYDGIKLPKRATVGSKCYPRSGLGFKFRLQLNNTVGIIDSDYYNSDNEGHIFAKITNDTNEEKVIGLKSGEGFMQGIFVEYGITEDDDATGIRNGGFGSTTE